MSDTKQLYRVALCWVNHLQHDTGSGHSIYVRAVTGIDVQYIEVQLSLLPLKITACEYTNFKAHHVDGTNYSNMAISISVIRR